MNVATIFIDTRVKFKDFDDYWRSNADFSSSFSGLLNELTTEDRQRFKAEVKALSNLRRCSMTRQDGSSTAWCFGR